MIWKPTHIIIHNSATPDGKTASWDDIRRYHMTDPHHMWADIGYHAGVELIDNEYIVLAGRPLNRIGAHCKAGGMNSVSLGFCFVGNYDLTEPPSDMLVKGATYLKGWMDVFNIPIDHVQPHRKYESAKTCPGLKFDMEMLKGLLV